MLIDSALFIGKIVVWGVPPQIPGQRLGEEMWGGTPRTTISPMKIRSLKPLD